MSKNNTILILAFLLLFSCKQYKELPDHFKNYDEAVELVKDKNFEVEETTDTSESNWIYSAIYRGNEDKGYLILEMKRKEYIFENVPYSVWQDFKDAESKGKFYNRNIKGKYSFDLD